jgi:hypothetical protein
MKKFGTDDGTREEQKLTEEDETKGNPDTSEKRWLLRGVRFTEFLRHWRYAFDVVVLFRVLFFLGADFLEQGSAVFHGKGFLEGLEGQTKPSVS